MPQPSPTPRAPLRGLRRPQRGQPPESSCLPAGGRPRTGGHAPLGPGPRCTDLFGSYAPVPERSRGLSEQTPVTRCKFNFTSCPGSWLLAPRARPCLSSGWSAASPEPTAQSPAPPREPPPGRPGQRVRATVARRPLVPSGSQGDAPHCSLGSSRLGSLGSVWDHGAGGHKGMASALRHSNTWASTLTFNRIQKGTHSYTGAHTHELTCSLELTFTTHTHLRELIQSHRHTHMVYA